MDLDSFLGEKRWEILKFIAEKPASPLELSEELSTTVSYISQQLKLLEAFGIIHKTKTGLAEKGKPRNVYSISNELIHMTILSEGLSSKKTIYLTPYHKAIISIWSISDSSLHESYTKFLMHAVYLSKDIDSAWLDLDHSKIYVVASAAGKAKLKAYADRLEKNVKYEFVEEGKILPNYIPLMKGELNRT